MIEPIDDDSLVLVSFQSIPTIPLDNGPKRPWLTGNYHKTRCERVRRHCGRIATWLTNWRCLPSARSEYAHSPKTVSAFVWKNAFLSCALMAMASCTATSSGWY